MTQPDRLTIEDVEVLLAGYRERGKITKASLAGQLLEYMRDNERLRSALKEIVDSGDVPMGGKGPEYYIAEKALSNKDTSHE